VCLVVVADRPDLCEPQVFVTAHAELFGHLGLLGREPARREGGVVGDIRITVRMSVAGGLSM
jgi:hypothetical protein